MEFFTHGWVTQGIRQPAMWVGPDANASKVAAQDGWSHNAVFPDRHFAVEDVRNALERVGRARVAAEEKNRRGVVDEPQTYQVEAVSILLPLAIGVRQDKAVGQGRSCTRIPRASSRLRTTPRSL